MTTIITGSGWSLTRVCAHCEQEAGVLDRRDKTKTHGHCRRHFIELLMDDGMSREDVEGEIKQFGADVFCPDLREAMV